MIFHFNGLVFDPARRELRRGGEISALTPKCRDLLLLFLASPGRPLSRGEILDKAWPATSVSDEALSFQISELRKSLGPQAALLKTLPREGYVWEGEAPQTREDGPDSGPAAEEERVTGPYQRGLEELRRGDAGAALRLLDEAALPDPEAPLILAARARALALLGHDRNSADAAERAMARAQELSPEERLRVEAEYWEARQDWTRSIPLFRQLTLQHSGELEAPLRLAAALTADGRGGEALVCIEDLRSRLPAAAGDPRTDLEEAAAAAVLADHARQRRAARAAAEKGDDSGTPLLAARARLLEGMAELALGDSALAEAAYRSAEVNFSAAGDRLGVARALNNLAVVMAAAGQLHEARRLYEQVLAEGRALGHRAIMANALNNLGNRLADEGDFDGAQKAYEEALIHNRESGRRQAMAVVLINLAEKALWLGRLDQARRYSEESLEIARQIGNRRVLAHNLYDLGEIHSAGGDLPQARHRHEEALALRLSLGVRQTIAESRLALARLDLAERHWEAALSGAQQATEEFSARHSGDQEVFARLCRCEALLGLARADDAAAELHAAEARSGGSQNPEVEVRLALLRGRWLAARTDPGAAPALERALELARKARLRQAEFEARLALIRLEPRPAAALRALRGELESAGYLRLAAAAT